MTRPTQSYAACLPAFTLIECLVAVGVIGFLVALLVPAVQSAREAARRTQCVANMRQIGIALSAYNGQYNRFPGDMLPGLPDSMTNSFSVFVPLLPYLEQQALYSAINLDFMSTDSPESPIVDHHTVRRITLDVFLCPSDGEANRRVNYRFNRGRFGIWPGGALFDGPFGAGVVASAATVTDGLSRTAFLSERVAGNFRLGSADPVRNVRFSVHPIPVDSWSTEAELTPLCLKADPFGWEATSGRYWLYTGHPNTSYNHNGLPNDPRPSCGGYGSSGDMPPYGFHPPRSFHSGGVNLLFGDGHVEYVSQTVNEQAWLGLGTRAGGE